MKGMLSKYWLTFCSIDCALTTIITCWVYDSYLKGMINYKIFVAICLVLIYITYRSWEFVYRKDVH